MRRARSSRTTIDRAIALVSVAICRLASFIAHPSITLRPGADEPPIERLSGVIDAPSIASRARARSAGLRLRLTLESSEMVSVIISTTGADRVGRWVPTWPRVSAGDAPGSLNSADASHWTNGADMMTRPEHLSIRVCSRACDRHRENASPTFRGQLACHGALARRPARAFPICRCPCRRVA